MPITPTKLNIMNAALRKVGSYFLDSTDTTSTTYLIANQAYSDAILEIFSEHRFHYNTKKVTLTATNAAVLTDRPHQYEFQLPSDFNTLYSLEHPTQFYKIADYAIEQDKVYLDEPSINIYYTFIPDLAQSAVALPPFLNRLIVMHIAQALSIELSGSESRHEILFQQYVVALRRARVLSARQGAPQSPMDDSTSRILGTQRTYGKIQ